jgi:hypothetical protein
MMNPHAAPDTGPSNTSDIPHQVETAFLEALEERGVPAAIVKRLRDALHSDKKITRQALGDALFKEETIP